MSSSLHSSIYEGVVQHRRLSPNFHQFQYRVFMMYLDLDEIDEVLSLSPFWSKSRFALARFIRSDFHGDADKPLKQAIADTLKEAGVEHCGGPIRMLVNMRYFGYNMNPLSTYYCFDKDGETIKNVIAEVHNTPWKERHAYVLPAESCSGGKTIRFDKRFHVSPFNSTDMHYRWRSTEPGEQISINIENWQEGEKIMDASLNLQRQEISSTSLNKILIRFPFMTVKVIAAIYWQALQLWLKKVPYHPHPRDIRE